ncbi:hypothetical protein ACFLUH_04330 [Chloroflexota bacterium]
MVVKLSTNVLEKFGLQPSCSINKLKGKLEEVAAGQFNIFHSEASKDEILNIAVHGCDDRVEIHNPIHRIKEWDYHKITNDTKEIAEVVHIPHYSSMGLATKLSIPPTEAEKVIVRAWHLKKEVIESSLAGEEELVNNRIVVLWRSSEYESFTDDSRAALYSLLHIGGSEDSSVYNEKLWEEWQRSTTINLTDGCCLLEVKDKTDLVLFKVAFEETAIKWRFLSLYRILERGYLKSILQNINQDFMKSPKSTVNDASQRLDAEYMQFIGLVTDNDLNSFFEDFADCIENLSSSMNKYAIMLKREISNKETNKNSKYASGVLQCYRVRCSIVHASSSGLVIDEFDDADDALRSLIIPLESAVMKYLGINML